MIVADSSVWIDHFRNPQAQLPRLIDYGELWMHPYVICELALGSVPDRARFVTFLQSLPCFEPADDSALLQFVNDYELHGKGVGLVDAELLRSCAEAKGHLWSHDKRLLAQAARLGLAYQP